MSSFAGTSTVPDYSVAGTPAAPGSLASFSNISRNEAMLASVTTGAANPSAASVYEAYYGPTPTGLQNVDVMGHIARTNLTLPAYYQGKNLYLERVISWGVADLEDCAF